MVFVEKSEIYQSIKMNKVRIKFVIGDRVDVKVLGFDKVTRKSGYL
ncbi:hypothetical protein MIDIC_20012 [Alphaproteobacteria bacterium]